MGNKLVVSKLNISKFRHFKDVEFNLGRKITVISGQNGVGKSNILSLIASGSGLTQKTKLGSNFQPEFNDFFHIDSSEEYSQYKLYLTYTDIENNSVAFTKRISFKDDTATKRGIRLIPRTTNEKSDKYRTIKDAEKDAKLIYKVGGSARVPIPTIYLSLSRLYPLGEREETVVVKDVNKRNALYKCHVDDKFKEWYNMVIPSSIVQNASLSKISKKTSPRQSLHMDMADTPTLSQSVGQDNVGNIISALVDIFLLSCEGNNNGALICIDEIEVSLHPDTQIRLLNLLDLISDKFHIQFVLSTHSLTIIKEMLKKEKASNENYSVVYLKNPSLPQVTKIKDYRLLKADLFNGLTFNRPKPKIYFEDDMGRALFNLLIKSFSVQYKTVFDNKEDIKTAIPALAEGMESVVDYENIHKEILNLEDMIGIDKNLNQITTKCGCEDLLSISEADQYFKRVIILLDGDARYKEPSQKPRISDYLTTDYSNIGKSDRKHGPNICFFPAYFAPESYLYKIIFSLVNNQAKNIKFWRSLEENEATSLYTADKIKMKLPELTTESNNDNLKQVLKIDGQLWKFIIETNMLDYYYSNYDNLNELIHFIENLQKAYNITKPLTEANRYS